MATGRSGVCGDGVAFSSSLTAKNPGFSHLSPKRKRGIFQLNIGTEPSLTLRAKIAFHAREEERLCFPRRQYTAVDERGQDSAGGKASRLEHHAILAGAVGAAFGQAEQRRGIERDRERPV